MATSLKIKPLQFRELSNINNYIVRIIKAETEVSCRTIFGKFFEKPFNFAFVEFYVYETVTGEITVSFCFNDWKQHAVVRTFSEGINLCNQWNHDFWNTFLSLFIENICTVKDDSEIFSIKRDIPLAYNNEFILSSLFFDEGGVK